MGSPTDNTKRLNILKSFFASHRRLPSYAEMLNLFGLASKNAIFKIMNKLSLDGYIAREGVQWIPSRRFFAIPMLGQIQAGYPVVEEYYEESELTLDQLFLATPGVTYALKVKGDSMNDAGIREGDLVILDRNRIVATGDVVAALVDGEWTLKYFDRGEKKPILRPANDKYTNIDIENDLEIGGVVVSVIRRYY